MIDTHCHLTAPQFQRDCPAVIEKCFINGITAMVTLSESLEDARQCIALADSSKKIFCAAGVHPHRASTWNDESEQKLREFLNHPSVVAVGEIGLDYHYDVSPRDAQKRAFREQLLIAKDAGIPAVVHTREALEDTWRIVDDVRPPKLVIHCCSESFENIERFLDVGCFLSFTGIATFPKSETIRETIRRTPLERIMAETDAPYLAPVPYRGRRCEPWMVKEVIACIAQCKGLALEKAEEILDTNARSFFGLSSFRESSTIDV